MTVLKYATLKQNRIRRVKINVYKNIKIKRRNIKKWYRRESFQDDIQWYHV